MDSIKNPPYRYHAGIPYRSASPLDLTYAKDSSENDRVRSQKSDETSKEDQSNESESSDGHSLHRTGTEQFNLHKEHFFQKESIRKEVTIEFKGNENPPIQCQPRRPCKCDRKPPKRTKPDLTGPERQHLLRMFDRYCTDTCKECCAPPSEDSRAFENLQLTPSKQQRLKSIFKLCKRGGCVNNHAVNQKFQVLNLTPAQISQVKEAHKEYSRCNPYSEPSPEKNKYKLRATSVPSAKSDNSARLSSRKTDKYPSRGKTLSEASSIPRVPESRNQLRQRAPSKSDDSVKGCKNQVEVEMIGDAVKQLIQELKGSALDSCNTKRKNPCSDTCPEGPASRLGHCAASSCNPESRNARACTQNNCSGNALLQTLQRLKQRLLFLQHAKCTDAPRDARGSEVKGYCGPKSHLPCENAVIQTSTIEKLQNILQVVQTFQARCTPKLDKPASLVASDGPDSEKVRGSESMRTLTEEEARSKSRSTFTRLSSISPRPLLPNPLAIQRIDPRFGSVSISESSDTFMHIPLVGSNDKPVSEVGTISPGPPSFTSVRSKQSNKHRKHHSKSNRNNGDGEAFNRGRIPEDPRVLKQHSLQPTRSKVSKRKREKAVEVSLDSETVKPGSQKTVVTADTSSDISSKINPSGEASLIGKPVGSDESKFGKSSSNITVINPIDNMAESVHYLYSRGDIPNSDETSKTFSAISTQKSFQRNIKNSNYWTQSTITGAALIMKPEKISIVLNPESSKSSILARNAKNSSIGIPRSIMETLTPRNPYLSPLYSKRDEFRSNLHNNPYNLIASNYQPATPHLSRSQRLESQENQITQPNLPNEATEIVANSGSSSGDRDQTVRRTQEVRQTPAKHHSHREQYSGHYSHPSSGEYRLLPPPHNSQHQYPILDDRGSLNNAASEHPRGRLQEGDGHDGSHHIRDTLKGPDLLFMKSKIPFAIQSTNLSDIVANSQHDSVSRMAKITEKKQTTHVTKESTFKIDKVPTINEIIPANSIQLTPKISFRDLERTRSIVTDLIPAQMDGVKGVLQDTMKIQSDSPLTVGDDGEHPLDLPIYKYRSEQSTSQTKSLHHSSATVTSSIASGPSHHHPRPEDQVSHHHSSSEVTGVTQQLPARYGTSAGTIYEIDKLTQGQDVYRVVIQEVIHKETRYDEETQTEVDLKKEKKEELDGPECMENDNPSICDPGTYQTKQLSNECCQQLDPANLVCFPLLTIPSTRKSVKRCRKYRPNPRPSKSHCVKTKQNQSDCYPLNQSTEITAHRFGVPKRAVNYVCCPLTPEEYFPATTTEGENIICLDYKTLKRATKTLRGVDPISADCGSSKSKRWRRRLQKLTVKTGQCCPFSKPAALIPEEQCPPPSPCWQY